MKLQLHPSAIAALNEQANVIAECVGIHALAPRDVASPFKPEVYSSATLTNAQMRGPMLLGEVDRNGAAISRYVQEANGLVGFDQNTYPKLRKLAHSIQRTDAFRDLVSVQFVEDAVFNWSLEKTKGNVEETACEHIAREAEQKICLHELWVPVYGLYVQSPLSVGPIVFKTITGQMIEQWHQRIATEVKNNPRTVFKLENDKKQLLGFAAATCEITAEPIRANEIASDLADKAISILRLFATANFDPTQFSYCVPLGSHQRYGHHYLSIRNGAIVGETRGITPKGEFPWVIDDALLGEMNSCGLLILNSLFAKQPKSPLEELVFEALLLYSKAPLIPTLAEKLLYMFAALESILLRDEKETPTETIAERLAFLAEREPDARLEVRKSVKRAYQVRSRFVHHGKREDADLTHFFHSAWAGICNIAGIASKFRTKAELLDHLEQYKYRA